MYMPWARSDSGSDKVERWQSMGHFVDMAMAAYEDASMVSPKFPYVSKSKLIKSVRAPGHLLSKITTDTQLHVCLMMDGSLAFVFRGTETHHLRCMVRDLVTNLHILPVTVELYDGSRGIRLPLPANIRAHKGFQTAFQDVTKTDKVDENICMVAKALGANESNVKRIACIGHSLGGALATLCAQWCRYVGYPKAEIWCVTIGSPRVGNKEFVKDFNIKVIGKNGRSDRIVNKGDVIPHLPLSRFLFLDYEHVGGLMPLDGHPTNQSMITSSNIPRNPSFPCNIPKSTSFKDHHVDSYKESILSVIMYLYTRTIHTT